MSIVKTKLKNARDSIGKKDYNAAKNFALQVLDFEPDNYNANVFLGLASLELGEYDASEQAYNKATETQPEQLLAWQGLSKFYERREEWDKYGEVLHRLMDIYGQSNDATKCGETLQKYINLRREHGSPSEVIDALSLFLPDSPYYQVLSSLPLPDATAPTSTTTFIVQTSIHDILMVLEEIIELIEKQEETYVKKEFEKRRTRLGAGSPDKIRKEIGREVWGSSRLPSLYEEILNHPKTSDTLRREIDSKLLRYKLKYLYSLPPSDSPEDPKRKVANEVAEIIRGVVILKIPDELAWTLVLDGKDVETVEEYDYSLLRQFVELFPDRPLSALFRGYFVYMGISLTGDNGSETEGDALHEDRDAGYDMVLEAYSSTDSLLATRITAEIYKIETDYNNAIQISEKGLQRVCKFESDNTTSLPRVKLGFKVILASSCVHHFPPKHHQRASILIDEILQVSPNNIPGLMGRGYILEQKKKWKEAGEMFERITRLLPDDLFDGLRAREEYAWCVSQAGDLRSGISHLREVLNALNEIEGSEQDRARCHWRLGRCHWDLSGEGRGEAYKCFIAALKCDSAYAPAFTSLGIYYTEHASPPDPTRASKCFQKAFELDSRESDAARRLAQGFADEQDWDLVEVVARRTIEGEGGPEGTIGKDASSASGRLLPTNVWAYKALGIVELTHRNYVSAISSLQVALRAEPEDHLMWLRLGEAYYRSGKHTAALKALSRAHELNREDWMCQYYIAEVYRQLGQYQQAIDQLQSILSSRDPELCALVSLAQTYLNLGREELNDVFVARAEESFRLSIRTSFEAIKISTGFRAVLWKIIADALYFLGMSTSFCDEIAISGVVLEAAQILEGEISSRLAGIISSPSTSLEAPLTPITLLELAVMGYDHRITLGSSENAAVGSAWYDLAIGLRSLAEKLAHGTRRESAESQAIKCLTEAIRACPMVDDHWIALGDANFVQQPKTAQHAYVRALEINSKNATTWTNLGLLYFYHNDYELANEAFYRAQSSDPDYSLAWLGQALLASASGHEPGAIAILEHAVGLVGFVPEADYQYAFKGFSRLKDVKGISTSDAFIPAFFVLDRYCKSRPDDAAALHLFGLVCERINQPDLAVKWIQKAISILEASYEESEDSEIERQFAIAHCNIGRLKLSLGDLGGALESFESALGLLPEDENEEQHILLRAQAQFGSGIAQFRHNDLETALSCFESSLETAQGNPAVRGEVTVLLAQALWAIGTDDTKELAKTKLLECISEDPENLTAINTLAAMGILTDDDSLVDAALLEILALPIDDRTRLDPERHVDHLLLQHHLGQENVSEALAASQKAVHVEPSRSIPRNQLANLLLQTQQYESVLPVLSGAAPESLDTSRRMLQLKATSEAVGGVPHEASRLAQKSVMMKPSDLDSWNFGNYQFDALLKRRVMGEESPQDRNMEPMMDSHQRGLVDACFEEGQFDSGIRVLEQLRSADHRPSPSHIRQLLYIALYPPDVEKKLADQPPGSPSKADKRRQKTYLKIPAEASTAAQKALFAIAQTNSLEAVFTALPSYSGSAEPELSNESFSQVAKESVCIGQCRSCWSILEKDFIQPHALQEVRRGGQNHRRVSTGESEDEHKTSVLAEHAWPILEWFLFLFERDELRAEAEGMPRHSPLLLNQLPQPKGRNLRWEVDTPLNIVFTCMSEDERRQLLGVKLLSMILNLACTTYFDFQAFVISVYKRVAADIPDEFLSLLSSLPPTPSVLRFKVAFFQKCIGPSTSTRPPPRPKPQARTIPKARGRQDPTSPEILASVDSSVQSVASKPFLPPFADICQALEKPQKSHSANATIKFELLVSYGTLQSQFTGTDRDSEWTGLLRSGRWRQLLNNSFKGEDDAKDYRDTLSLLVPYW
ncbi:antiviral protein [Moniliophthora roreri]|nr:antiviral protein [Moniliophthora roreri]